MLCAAPTALLLALSCSSTMPSAFILGAGQNVGKAVAQMLAKNGYQVALGARSHAAAAAAEPFVPVHVDVTQPESIAAAFKTVEDAIGAPGVVVYNGPPLPPLFFAFQT